MRLLLLLTWKISDRRIHTGQHKVEISMHSIVPLQFIFMYVSAMNIIESHTDSSINWYFYFYLIYVTHS